MSNTNRTIAEVEEEMAVLQKYNAEIPTSLLDEQKRLIALGKVEKTLTNLSRSKLAYLLKDVGVDICILLSYSKDGEFNVKITEDYVNVVKEKHPLGQISDVIVCENNCIKYIGDIAEPIRDRRTELGMSRRQLFLQSGLSKPCMEKIEKGENTSLKSLLKVFEVLGLKLVVR